MKKFVFALAGLFLALSQAQAFDQKQFSENVKEFWNLDSRDGVSVGEPAPSKYGNLMVATVTIRKNPYFIYVTPDEKFYFWGEPVDATKEPDKVRWDNINLEGVHAKGSAKAPVTIVEFFNFQCPHCRDAHFAMDKELYKDYTKDQVRLVLKNYPLDQQEWSEAGAVAAECASLQREDGYLKMADLLFSTDTVNAQNFRPVVTGYAESLNLDMSKFNKCFENKETLEKVKADKLEGTKAGVSSTPTFFINGRLKRGFKNFEDLKVVIDEKLAVAK